MTQDLSDEAIALFREAPESFIAGRDLLAKRLLAEGREDDAARVKTLRKPTVPAWALNQLADRDPEAVETLLQAGVELRAAQQAALSSSRYAERLRTATAERRKAVASLVRAAADVLADADRASGSHLDEITAALEVAAVDHAAGENLRTGTFQRPPRGPAGLGDVFALTSVPAGDDVVDTRAPEAGRKRESATNHQRRTDREATAKVDLAKLRRDRDSAARRARKDRERADGFAQELIALEARIDTVRAKHSDAKARAEATELEAKRAERALSRATERREP